MSVAMQDEHTISHLVKLYRLAAEQGDAVAQCNLGFMYENGDGVPVDYVQAHMWFNLSGVAKVGTKIILDALAEKMTPAQIAEAEKLAREWAPK